MGLDSSRDIETKVLNNTSTTKTVFSSWGSATPMRFVYFEEAHENRFTKNGLFDSELSVYGKRGGECGAVSDKTNVGNIKRY